MKPTYKLLVGIPGKSNAFAISKRLGLKQEILDKASSLMKSDDISIEELMKSIYDNKIEIEKEKENIQKNANQIEMLRKSLEKENTDVKRHEQELIENAKREARALILSAKDKVNDILHQMNELQNNMNSDSIKNANQLRNKLNDKLQDVNSSNDNGLNLEILKTLNSRDMMKKNTLNKKISPNSSVSFSKNGNYKGQNISSEINVIGLNVDEATFLIDKYLDDCVIAKLSPIRIVHGKGTGKLRQGIHKYLKTNPYVKSFRLGTFGEGEMGVTVVELKK